MRAALFYARPGMQINAGQIVANDDDGNASNIQTVLNQKATIKQLNKIAVLASAYPNLQAAINDASGKTLIIDNAYSVDNSAADALVIANDNVHITGWGAINGESINFNVIKVTGKNVILDDFSISGPGAYDTSGTGGAVIPGLIYVDGTGLTSRINCTIQNVEVREPGKMGIVVYKAVGVDIIKNDIGNSLSVPTWLNTSNNHLIRVYASAFVNVIGNTVQGFSEGIVIQAYPDVTFDDFTGDPVSNKCRHIVVANNNVTKQYDHSIYFSNDCEHYICTGNTCWPASDAEGGEGTCGLKLEGGFFVAYGNRVREGVQLRNPYNFRLTNNMIVLDTGTGTTHNPSKYGILSQDTIFQRDLANGVVDDNTIIVNGAIQVDCGIRMQGAVWSGFQSRITDLSVSNNTIIGVGKMLAGNGNGIQIHQNMLVDGSSHVIGNSAKNVRVQGNTIVLAAFTAYQSGCGSNGVELLNVDNAIVSGNGIRNFTINGVNSLGVRDSYIGSNNVEGNTDGVTQRFGFLEASSDLTLHVDSKRNVYDINAAQNVAYKYFLADETCDCRDRIKLINIGAVNANQTVSPYDQTERMFWGPTTAGHTLALDTAVRPWGIGQDITVVNTGTQSFTVTNTGTVIAAGNKITFCNKGANTFTPYV